MFQKTKEFTITFPKNQEYLEPLLVNNQPIEAVQTIKLLGLQLL